MGFMFNGKDETHTPCKQIRFNLYCKFGNFRENFIFANGVKRHICHVKNSPPGYDLPISVNNSDIAISGEFYFHGTMRSFAKNKMLAKISEFTVTFYKL